MGRGAGTQKRDGREDWIRTTDPGPPVGSQLGLPQIIGRRDRTPDGCKQRSSLSALPRPLDVPDDRDLLAHCMLEQLERISQTHDRAQAGADTAPSQNLGRVDGPVPVVAIPQCGSNVAEGGTLIAGNDANGWIGVTRFRHNFDTARGRILQYVRGKLRGNDDELFARAAVEPCFERQGPDALSQCKDGVVVLDWILATSQCYSSSCPLAPLTKCSKPLRSVRCVSTSLRSTPM